MIPIITLNLFIGYLGRGFIDNAAHVGGLLSGAALAVLVQYRRPGERAGIAATWRVLQIAALALVVVSFFKIAQHMNLSNLTPSSQVAQPANGNDEIFVNYAKAMNQAQEVFLEVVHDKEMGHVDQAVKNLEAVPPLDPKADELRNRLRTLLLTAKSSSASSPSPSPGRVQKPARVPGQDLIQEFRLWSKEYNEWLKGVAQTYK
jgi:hypothetical protein